MSAVVIPMFVIEKELADLKSTYNIKYMTKEKCRKIAGWHWGRRRVNRVRLDVLGTVYFNNDLAKTYYCVKWAEYIHEN